LTKQSISKTRHTTYMMIQDIVHEKPVSATERIPVAGLDFFAYAMKPESLMNDATKAHALAVFDEAAEQSRQILDLATMAAVFLRCWATESGIPAAVLIADVIKGQEDGELPD
jgi:hypothetical protein